jgi:hypothetical protein
VAVGPWRADAHVLTQASARIASDANVSMHVETGRMLGVAQGNQNLAAFSTRKNALAF